MCIWWKSEKIFNKFLFHSHFSLLHKKYVVASSSKRFSNNAFLFSSGAAKSTFTKLLIRELLPTEGNILVNGKSITRLKQRQIPHYRRNIGFIFQNYRLLGDRTAFENVAFSPSSIFTSIFLSPIVPFWNSLDTLINWIMNYFHSLSGYFSIKKTALILHFITVF